MKVLLVALGFVAVAGCTYDANFSDCTVTCSMAAPDCPEGFSCSTAEGMCRAAENVSISCAAVLDGGADEDATWSPDGGSGSDADPICTECDPLAGTGCPVDQRCILTGGETKPYCSSTVPTGTGTQGQSPPCALGYSAYGAVPVCYRNCTQESSCPASTVCSPLGGGDWDMCGFGICQ